MEKFKIEINRLQKNTNTPILNNLRSTVLNSYYYGLKSVEPGTLIKNAVRILEGTNSEPLLSITGMEGKISSNFTLNLSRIKKIVLIGGGKATGSMANELINILGNYSECTGIVNIPYDQKWGENIEFSGDGFKSSVKVNYSSHPIPDENGIIGTSQMIDLIQDTKKQKENSLVFVLISGGGSALMPLPKKGLNLDDLQNINSVLLKTEASIHEINTVRKHLSDFKGGNLARIISPIKSFALIISDVIGDDLDIIASGPTVPDSSTYRQAFDILEKYRILNLVNGNIVEILQKGVRKEIDENPKHDDLSFSNIENVLIGSAEIAKTHIERNLISQGIKNWRTLNRDIFFPVMRGTSSEYAKKISLNIKEIDNIFSLNDYDDTYYLINSGELTVSVKGKGIGGRNQEMLLSLLIELQKLNIENLHFSICSMAFDGIEGNSPAAGAILDSQSVKKAKNMNLNGSKFVHSNDSYSFFKKLGDQIEIGQTNTNINDIVAIIFKKK